MGKDNNINAKPPTGDDIPEILDGVVERIVFFNQENFYTIAVLKVGNKRECTIVGNLAGLKPKEVLHAEGKWITDPKYGHQFKVESYQKLLPKTTDGMQAYLSSGLIKGIGSEYAKRIIDKFGTETFDIIEKHPEKLRNVEGIGEKRCKTIVASWKEHQVLRDLTMYLCEHGISQTFAAKVYKQYGDNAIKQLKQNPYQLAIDINGIGFKKADAIAMNLGIPLESLDRVQAGIHYILLNDTLDGNTFSQADDLIRHATEELKVPTELVIEGITALQQSNRIVLEILPNRTRAVYLRPFYNHEVSVAQQLVRLCKTPTRFPKINFETECAEFEKIYNFTLAPKQREAVQMAVGGRSMVITGGPGTGKTTILKAILEMFDRHGIRFILAAPTGRAAKRLQEMTHRFAQTIHRMLKYLPDRGGYQYNASNPLKTDVVIIDESSMIDITLADALLKAIKPQCSLILVGDADQLPSVGAGCFLNDIITCQLIPVIKLDTIFRQAQGSLIIENAHKINAGEFPILPTDGLRGKGNFLFIPANDQHDALRKTKQLLEHDLHERFPSLNIMQDVQVLSPMRRGASGCGRLNSEIQQVLNPKGVTMTYAGTIHYRVHDKIMQIENNYDKDVYNGDIGFITKIDPVEQQLSVDFDGRIVTYEYSELDELEPAYAITVHKSQGSEYKVVVFLITTEHFVLLQRNLVYTAVTRGRKFVILIGQEKALGMAINNKKNKPRLSALDQRIKTAWNA